LEIELACPGCIAWQGNFNGPLCSESDCPTMALDCGIRPGTSRRFWCAHYERAANLPETVSLYANVARAIGMGRNEEAAAALKALMDNVGAFTRSTLDH
jgi:hypothetical protein